MGVYKKLNFPINKNNISILSREDIRVLAETVIEDYCPKLLVIPGKLDVDDFMEYYLDLGVEVYELSHNGIYLGRCIFNDNECVPIYDWQNEKILSLSPKANTILIEKQLYMDESKEALRRFTVAHECAHYILHKAYFTKISIKFFRY